MGLLLQLALRNLVSHRVKTGIVGSILVFGSFLVVVGLALLDGVENAMRASITGSVVGDFQLYDARANDPLVMLGSSFISVPDVGRIDRFEALHDVVADLDEVEALVPMGFDLGSITAPGQLDRALEDLRALVRNSAPSEASRASGRTVRRLVSELAAELDTRKAIASDAAKLEQDIAVLEQASSEAFWVEFETNPLAALERLDTKVAPLSEGGRQMLFRFLGTDLERFARHFDGFRMVKGQPVPKGQRGFLFSDKFYERAVKHRIARALDDVLSRHQEDGELISEDSGQQSRIRRMKRQWRRITRELDQEDSEVLQEALRAELELPEAELPELLETFLDVDDDTVARRHAYFYEVIAPKLDLYALQPGDRVTIRSFTRTGFLRSVNVTFFGTFAFRGLESSDLAGIYNLTDLATFRRLFGVMSDDERAELADLREQVGLTDVGIEDAEAALFGDEAAVVSAASDTRIAPIEEAVFEGRATRGLGDALPESAVRTGMVLDAAVVLREGVDRESARERLETALAESELPVQVTDWQAAAGLIGQFIVVIRLVLYVAIAIIFVVALVIINNSMVMTTMERVTEIGTLRAIGAQRGQILVMFFLETMVLAVLAAAVGVGVGAALIEYWGQFGLPAPSRALRFMFGGPELFPHVQLDHLVSGMLTIVVISVVSTAYPAWLGASIQPVEAMRTEE